MGEAAYTRADIPPALTELPDLTAFVIATLDCFSSEALTDLVCRTVGPMGFGRFICATYLPLSITPRPAPQYIGNFPEEWRREYTSRDYWNLDVVFRTVTRSDAPVHWGAAMLQATAEESTLFERARAHGLADGVSLGILEPNGVRSFVTFASRDRFEPTEHVLFALKHVAIATHHRWRALLSHGGDPNNDTRMTLSVRETECLRLLREGFSNPQIARALNITPRTVQFHLRNAADKLGASGRTDTIARALRLGLIEPFA